MSDEIKLDKDDEEEETQENNNKIDKNNTKEQNENSNINNNNNKNTNSQNFTYQFIFKIILIGDSNTGKTSLINRFINKRFEDKYHCQLLYCLCHDVHIQYMDNSLLHY
jgi:tRNA U34 5-carboxymethylaminomethyl modifying GTPase MnmE/TrmE